MPRFHAALLFAFATAVAFAGVTPAQNTRKGVANDFDKRRTKVLAEAGQRHLELGSWARDAGLVPQATAQFLRAVEVSEGKNPGAHTVLALVRSYGDDFWTRKRKRVPKDVQREFEKRAAAAEAKSRREHLELAQRASSQKLFHEARKEYLTVLGLGGELEFDERNGWRIDKKKIDGELAEWLQEQTAPTDDGKKLFEAAGAAAPRLEGLVVCEDEHLQVRTDLPGDAAKQLHALGTALWPLLADRLEGAPARQLVLTVFAKRADYVAYLDARGMGDYAVAGGLADHGTFQTLVTHEYEDGKFLDEHGLHALVLHELSHLFFFGVAPAAMPDWFAEGFAESFGARDTFTWDGKTLSVGGAIPKDRIAEARPLMLPLRVMVDTRALLLMRNDKAKSHAFYLQGMLLHRFLQDEKCPWHARFEHFEAKCRGQVLGAPEGGRATPDPMPAGAQFKKLFDEDLDEMGKAFFVWLDGQ